MSAPARSATTVGKIDWSRLLSIPLRRDTAAQLTAFRKRFDETQRQLASLQEQKLDVDFAHYRSVLSNKAIVDEAEKAWKAFKPVKVDLAKQQQVLTTLEAKAVSDQLFNS
jgi:F-type H+-transporting ATPase subunit d